MSLIRSTSVGRCNQHKIGNIEHDEFGPNAHFTDTRNFFDVIGFFDAFLRHIAPVDCKTKVQSGHDDRKEIPIEDESTGERSNKNESDSEEMQGCVGLIDQVQFKMADAKESNNFDEQADRNIILRALNLKELGFAIM